MTHARESAIHSLHERQAITEILGNFCRAIDRGGVVRLVERRLARASNGDSVDVRMAAHVTGCTELPAAIAKVGFAVPRRGLDDIDTDRMALERPMARMLAATQSIASREAT